MRPLSPFVFADVGPLVVQVTAHVELEELEELEEHSLVMFPVLHVSVPGYGLQVFVNILIMVNKSYT